MHSRIKIPNQQAFAILILCAVVGLFSAPLRAEDKNGLSSQQRGEVKNLVREYIFENPEIISEAIVALQAKEEQASAEKQAQALIVHRKALFDPSEDTVIGNPKGDVTVVEFFDYNCGYCKSMFPAVREILEEDDDLRMVMKEFPILGPASLVAARAALASREQGKYSELHMALLGHRGSLNQDVVVGIAKDIGLDVDKLLEDMKKPEINDILADNMALAQDLGISGTPALIVGETIVPGAIGKGQLRELIANARE